MKEFWFKSDKEVYDKECNGLKNNTIREIDLNDERFLDLIREMNKGFKVGDLKIRITKAWWDEGSVKANPQEHSFVRNIRDISYYKNIMIITWGEKQ